MARKPTVEESPTVVSSFEQSTEAWFKLADFSHERTRDAGSGLWTFKVDFYNNGVFLPVEVDVPSEQASLFRFKK